MTEFWEGKSLTALDGLQVKVSFIKNLCEETGRLHLVHRLDAWYARLHATETPVFMARTPESVNVRLCAGIEKVEPLTRKEDEPKYLSYTEAVNLQQGDMLTIKGFSEPLAWDGKTNGKGVRVRLGDAPQPVWVDERNIDGVIRRGPTAPDKAGMYRNDDGLLFMLDDSGNWWNLGNGEAGWRLRPTIIDTVQLPLTPVRMEDAG